MVTRKDPDEGPPQLVPIQVPPRKHEGAPGSPARPAVSTIFIVNIRRLGTGSGSWKFRDGLRHHLGLLWLPWHSDEKPTGRWRGAIACVAGTVCVLDGGEGGAGTPCVTQLPQLRHRRGLAGTRPDPTSGRTFCPRHPTRAGSRTLRAPPRP